MAAFFIWVIGAVVFFQIPGESNNGWGLLAWCVAVLTTLMAHDARHRHG